MQAPTVSPTPQAVKPAYGRENNFDLMRLVAAWLVIVTHGYSLTGRDIDLEPLAYITNGGLHLSNLAVRTFFIISGYLITASAVRTPQLGVFARSRFLRLWPGLAVCILLTVLVLGPAFTTLPAGRYWTDPDTWAYLWYLVIVKLPLYLPGVFTDHHAQTINGSLWTLMYEVLCYVAVAGLMVLGLLRHRWIGFAVFGIWLAAYAYWRIAGLTPLLKYPFIHTDFNSEEFLSFAGYFFAGMIAYYLFKAGWRIPKWAPWASAAFLFAFWWLHIPAEAAGYSGFWLLFRHDVPYSFVLLPLIVFAIAFAPLPERWRHPLGRGRDWSYGIYIYGMPVQQTMLALLPAAVPFWGYQAVCLILVLPLAAASWAWIEGPALQLKGGKRSRE